ncbi:MAG: hypothetical protein KatS3mg096_710 [Candidatus Parcubacteria bacterium]|nr:MAG: hypothetical protein KatS3mg096_683 [Candidatus Parcubacteria bacterium]GIW67842.1 MAG: hypothetical protein KatS3mg096_710 [Candidatus Parcubacteria bacterium]
MKKLLILLFFGILLVGTVSALEFDNIKQYEDKTKTITIKNSFLGIPTTKIADITLLTPLVYRVTPGYSKIAEFNITFYSDYKKPFKSITFYDLNKNNLKINKNFDFKILDYENVLVDDYETICIPTLEGIGDCYQKKVGSHYERKKIWRDLNQEYFYKNTNFTIGIFTNVNEGDYVEWIPNFFGLNINEFASYVTYLKVSPHNMINNSYPPPYRAFSSGVGGGMEPYKLFDGNESSFAQTSTTTPWFFGIDLGSEKLVTNLTLHNDVSGTSLIKDAQFMGSNDNSTYTNIISITSQPNSAGNFTYNFTNNTIKYRYYKLVPSANYGATVISLWEMYLWGPSLPNITLNSPNNNAVYNSSPYPIIFNVSVTSPVGIKNVTLFLNGEVNETNSSGVNGTYLFIKDLYEGNYNWSIGAVDVDGLITNSSNRSLLVDATAPSILITYPTGNITYHRKNTNLTVNYSISDNFNLNSCWLSWKNQNITLNCSATSTSFNVTDGTWKNLTIYVNDSAGNLNYSTTYWGYRLFHDDEQYQKQILEGGSNVFTSLFLTNGSDITSSFISYNGSLKGSVITKNSNNNFTLKTTFETPSVTNDVNVSWFWVINQDTLQYNTSSINQTILNLGIDNCSSFTYTLYNFTIYNEKNRSQLSGTGDNTTGKVDIKIKSTTGNTIESFNKSYDKINPFRVCLNNNLSNNEFYNVDGLVEYKADQFVNEFYFLQNETLNKSTLYQNISLYDLPTTDAVSFKFSIKDTSFLPLEDALVEVYRKYTETGQYLLVERPKTDVKGETTASMTPDSVIYKIIIRKYGQNLKEITDSKAICQNPSLFQCLIEINLLGSQIKAPDFTKEKDINFTISYDNQTNSVKADFTILSNNQSKVTLVVSKEDILGTSLCTKEVVATTGTLICNLNSSIGNSTIKVKLYKDDYLVGSGAIGINSKPSEIYSGALIIFGLLIFLSILGAGISHSPVLTVASFMVGVFGLFFLNIFSNATGYVYGATIVWLVLAIIIILVKISNR